jgi:hypothetical protein
MLDLVLTSGYTTTSVFHKKNSIQLECVSKAYIKDLKMYLKRNTKFLPGSVGPEDFSGLSKFVEIFFRSHEILSLLGKKRIANFNHYLTEKSLRKVDFLKNGQSWLCVFSPKVSELDGYDNLVVLVHCVSVPQLCVLNQHAIFFSFRHSLQYTYRINPKILTVYYKYSMDKNFTNY